MVLRLDVTDSTEELDAKVSEVVTTLSRVDFLVNCAGMSVRGSVHETSMSTHKRIMDVDYFGMVNLTKCQLLLC